MFLGIDLLPLRGRSGKEYVFNVNSITDGLPVLGGVFYVVKMWREQDRPGNPAVGLIYLGRTKDLSGCLTRLKDRLASGTNAPNAIVWLHTDSVPAQLAIQLDFSHTLSPDQQDPIA